MKQPFFCSCSRPVRDDPGGALLEGDQPALACRRPEPVAAAGRHFGRDASIDIVVVDVDDVATVRARRRRPGRDRQGFDPPRLELLLQELPRVRRQGQDLGRLCAQDPMEQELVQRHRFSAKVTSFPKAYLGPGSYQVPY